MQRQQSHAPGLHPIHQAHGDEESSDKNHLTLLPLGLDVDALKFVTFQNRRKAQETKNLTVEDMSD